MEKVTTLACLFLSKDGRLAVQLLEPPLPEQYEVPAIPPGMMHAARLLGVVDRVRVFKRVADGGLPVYEEQ